MVVIAGVVYFTVREYMLDEAEERYLGFLLENHQEIRRKLSDVHVAAENNVHDIERDIDNPDKMFDHMQRLVVQTRLLSQQRPGIRALCQKGRGRQYHRVEDRQHLQQLLL